MEPAKTDKPGSQEKVKRRRKAPIIPMSAILHKYLCRNLSPQYIDNNAPASPSILHTNITLPIISCPKSGYPNIAYLTIIPPYCHTIA